MNVELLEKIITRIEAEPENLDMTMRHCGTAHCIGGWAETLAGKVIPEPLMTAADKERNEYQDHVQNNAREILGLTRTQANNLFHRHNWPLEFKNRYWDSGLEPSVKAAATIDRIKHFIKTNGAE